jgi:hypothetical protein
MGIPLRIAEPTGRHQRSLRRFVFSNNSDCPSGYHNASVMIGEISEAEADVHGDNWPHDDSRWPSACSCGYEFVSSDEWQRNDCLIYRLPDGTEFVNWGSARDVPPGTMIRVPWFDGHGKTEFQLGELADAWLIWLPDGGNWITTQAASGGGFWTVMGVPPMIDVSPSIYHNAPSGWHGFIHNGELVPA